MFKQLRLISRPVGTAKAENFNVTRQPIPKTNTNEFLVKVLYASIDPAMRGWMNDAKSYIAPVKLGDVMRAGAVGRIVESKNPRFSVGDYVEGMFGIQEFYLSSDGRGVSKIEHDPRIPLTVHVAALGMPGLTAYFGLFDIGKPKAGETVVISGAAGAVGLVVGQIAKIKGCRVVGIAGGADKCNWLLKELAFDAVIDYKNEDVRVALRKAAPNGVDIYFDNVGGEILNTVLTQINRGARIAVCGAISQYNSAAVVGPSNYLSLLVNRASMTGFIVFDYEKQYEAARREMRSWILDRKLISREQVESGGVENFLPTLSKLFSGENLGKLVLKIADDVDPPKAKL